MPNLTQIELPSGSVYDLVDQGARDLIAALNNWDYLVSTDAASTPYGVTWQSGSTTITGTLVASASTEYKIYLVPSSSTTGSDEYKEYITIKSGATYSWEMLGTIVAPDLTNQIQHKDSSHYGDKAGSLAYKDSASGSGTVAVPKTYSTTTTVATTESQSVSSTKETIDIKPNSTGTAANKYTPAGTNASSAVSGSCSVTATGSIAVATAGATDTINNPTSKSVVVDMEVATPSATQASGELVYCEVSGTKLTLKKFVESKGDSISTTSKTVKTGDAAYSFTGSSATGTITGTAAAQTFTGEDTYLKTASQVVTGTGSVTVPATFTSTTATDTTENKTVNVTVS